MIFSVVRFSIREGGDKKATTKVLESEKAAADCSDAGGGASKLALSPGARRARGGAMEEGAIAALLRQLHVNA